MHKAFKYRLYPNKEQTEILQRTLDLCREVYNAALQERRDTWNIIKQHPNFWYDVSQKPLVKDFCPFDEGFCLLAMKEHALSLYGQQNQLSLMKQERTEYQELSAAHILNDVCKRVDFAFKAFFRRAKQGKTPGYPRFQGRNRYDSFCYPDTSGWNLEDKHLHLTRIGILKVKLHRPVEGTIKTCTIKREGTHWYVIFSCETEEKPRPAFINDLVGIDVGLNTFATLSTGEGIPNPRYYRKTEEKLGIVQQELARKKKPHSKPKGKKATRRQKVVRRIAALHRKASRQRRDFLHKASRKLVDTYETVVFEDLQIANMVRRPKPKQDEQGTYVPNGAAAKAGLNKSISDAGWGMFMEFCTYKAAWAGRAVLTVNPKNTSQVCSRCGVVVPKSLEERVHSCPHCGLVIDRDVNAAINIRALGLKKIEGQSTDNIVYLPSQKKNEAGSASAFGLSPSLKRRRASRAAESASLLSFSQVSLWHDSPG